MIPTESVLLYGDSVGGRRIGGSPQRKDFLILFGPFFPGGFLEPPQTQCIKDHTQGGKAGGKGGKQRRQSAGNGQANADAVEKEGQKQIFLQEAQSLS